MARRCVELSGLGNPAQEFVVVDKIERCFGVKHVDQGKVMPAADLKVVEVMRRCDLDRAGALLGIRIVIGDDWHATADQRQDHVLADQIGIALVIRVHRDRGVTQHRFRPRGRDRDGAAR